MAGGLLAALVPREVVVAVREVDVGFLEDGCPLEGGACGCLLAWTERNAGKVVLGQVSGRRGMEEYLIP